MAAEQATHRGGHSGSSRYRPRHSAGGARTVVRPILYHEGTRHGSGPLHFRGNRSDTRRQARGSLTSRQRGDGQRRASLPHTDLMNSPAPILIIENDQEPAPPAEKGVQQDRYT